GHPGHDPLGSGLQELDLHPLDEAVDGHLVHPRGEVLGVGRRRVGSHRSPSGSVGVRDVALSVLSPRLPCVSRLLLLDGHSLAYRAFYALPAENFSTSTGQHTNAVYGFTSMLINVLRDEDPTHVAVAFDVSRQTFRLAEYTDYKAGRSATPSEVQGQIPLLHEVLDALNIVHVGVEGFEADDVIATLT